MIIGCFIAIVILLVIIDFFVFLFTGEFFLKGVTRIVSVITIVVGLPISFLAIVDEPINDCCSDSAVFAPGHKLSIYVLVFICVIVYQYSFFRKSLATPVIEVLINTILVLAVIFNIILTFQMQEFIWLIGTVPVCIMFVYELIKNQKLISDEYTFHELGKVNTLAKYCVKVIRSRFVYRFPILIILSLPVTILISIILLLFGQQPDSLIRAFTDTYNHGFSQLDHLCNNVECGGHFLCSVAAKGHRSVVKPIRYGERAGKKIICNRQLLISNAFEELIEERFPNLHKVIRRKYNRVGSFVHKYYDVFELKIIADLIYILMKPFEYIFLFTLYIFDKKPENRIAKQYLNLQDKKILSRIV
jgi:hypothetical protein